MMGTHALDCSKARGTVKRRISPHRHESHEPTPLCQLDDRFPALTAGLVIDRVRANQRAGKGMTYLFIDPDMSVYAISESHTAARQWASDRVGRWASFVGVYTTARRSSGAQGLGATVAGLVEDIREHLADLRPRVCPQVGCTQTDGKPCAFAGCPNRGAA